MNRLLAVLSGHFLIGRAEHEDRPTRDDLARLAIGQLMTHDCQFVMFLRETASPATPLLFDRQITGLFRMALSSMIETGSAHGAIYRRPGGFGKLRQAESAVGLFVLPGYLG